MLGKCRRSGAIACVKGARVSSRPSAVMVGARGVVRALVRRRMTAAMFCACCECVGRLVVAVGVVGGGLWRVSL